MNRIHSNGLIVSLAVSLATLSTGCAATFTKARVYGECSNRAGGGGECKVGAEATWEKSGPMFAAALEAMNISADAQSYELDTSGSTIPYPAQGDFVVSLSDSATGTVQAARTFRWIKVGTVLKAEDPNSINEWAYANSGSSDKITYEVVKFRSSYSSGQQVIAGQSRYEGNTQATYSVAFDGTSCPRIPTPTPCNPN